MFGTALRLQPDALVSCLLLCLADAERRSMESAELIRAAVAILERRTLVGHGAPSPSMGDGRAIASYLTYLLPELEARSMDAAILVREAADLLKGPAERRIARTLH